MFALEFCQALTEGVCDTSTDGTYTLEYVVSDHAVVKNNVGVFENTFIVDVTPPEVTFDGVPLPPEEAAKLQFGPVPNPRSINPWVPIRSRPA